MVADVRMLTGVVDDQRLFGEMIRIAESRAVAERVKPMLRRKAGAAGAEEILASRKVDRIGNSDLIRIKVVSGDAAHSNYAADGLALEFIRRCEELARGAGVVKIVQTAEVRGVDTIGELATLFLFGWPILMISIGLEIGYALGRNLGAKRERIQ